MDRKPSWRSTIRKLYGQQQEFQLYAEKIDAFSEWLDETMTEIGVERQNRIRIRLSLEEALLRVRDRFGEEQWILARIQQRFGRVIVHLEMEGEPYNILSVEEDELENICASILTSVQLMPQYTYNGRKNILRVTLPLKRINENIRLLLTFLAIFIVGVGGRMLLPAAFCFQAADAVLQPFYMSWWNILNAVSGPVMFFMTISSVINMGRFTEWGMDGRWIIRRYFVLDFMFAAAAIFLAFFFYRPLTAEHLIAGGVSVNWAEAIPGLFPFDIITPLIHFDAPQLLVIGIIIGSALNIVGTDASLLTKLILQINRVGLKICEWLSFLVPFVVCVLVSLELWMGRVSVLFGLWHCLLLSLAISAVCIALSILFTCRQMKVSPRTVIRKIRPPFEIAFRTGSLDEAYGETLHSCTAGLGIHHSLTVLGLPNGLIFYMPLCIVGLLVFITFIAQKYSISVSLLWYAFAAIITVLLSIAAPPVPGVNLITYSVLFGMLGIPESALIDAMIFDLVFNIAAAAGDQAMLQMELVLQADRLGLLDKRKLRNG